MVDYKDIKRDPVKTVQKGWGEKFDKYCKGNAKIGEFFLYHNENGREEFKAETVKALYIAKGKKLSQHFHIDKTEIFFLACGSIVLTLSYDGKEDRIHMFTGDTCIIRPGMVHSMEGIGDFNCLIEVSTLDSSNDSYRIKKGD